MWVLGKQVLMAGLLLSLGLPALGDRLPDGPLIVGYANWGECDTKMIEGVRSGVNVVIWFATNLLYNKTSGLPEIHGGPNYTCAAEIVGKTKAEGLPTVHLISVGGWDAPHPDTELSGEQWYNEWVKWNTKLARPDLDFEGFDGLDWDLEGNDNKASPINRFTPSTLELVGSMSQMLKQNGYIVSMAPPQSYFDQTTSEFNLNLLNSPSYDKQGLNKWHEDFKYAGRNVYAYLISKYGRLADGTIVFDFVSIQLYESFSPADFMITQRMVPAADYLGNLTLDIIKGWTCDFGAVPTLNFSSRRVALLPSQIVWGFSRGSNGDAKSLFVEPSAVGDAYDVLPAESRPRGFMFWELGAEGGGANGTKSPVFLAESFNDILHVR